MVTSRIDSSANFNILIQNTPLPTQIISKNTIVNCKKYESNFSIIVLFIFYFRRFTFGPLYDELEPTYTRVTFDRSRIHRVHQYKISVLVFVYLGHVSHVVTIDVTRYTARTHGVYVCDAIFVHHARVHFLHYVLNIVRDCVWRHVVRSSVGRRELGILP